MSFKIKANITPELLLHCHEINTLSHTLYPILLKKRTAKSSITEKIDFIEASLSMEKRSPSRAQLKKILQGDKTNAKAYDITAVNNLKKIISIVNKWDPLSIRDFKEVHCLLMNGLSNEIIGRWRNETVVVCEGEKITYVPPKPQHLTMLMQELFHTIRSNKKLPWLIKACIFHYGIQTIHPFFDGNGRMGRIWQHLLLLKEGPIFHHIMIGMLIKHHARGYYKALDQSDKNHDAGVFIAFCLQEILSELKRIKITMQPKRQMKG